MRLDLTEARVQVSAHFCDLSRCQKNINNSLISIYFKVI